MGMVDLIGVGALAYLLVSPFLYAGLIIWDLREERRKRPPPPY